MKNKDTKRFTTSKQILWVSTLLFIGVISCAVYFSYEGIDTSIFMYLIPTVGGINGATVIFYLNKSKMENIFKFKISFLEYKIELVDKHPDKASLIEDTVSDIEDALDSEVDNTMSEAINEDIDIQSY